MPMSRELVPAIRDNLVFDIYRALMDSRYEPPKRRKSAWSIGWQEDADQAKRVAVAIADLLYASGYVILARPPSQPH